MRDFFELEPSLTGVVREGCASFGALHDGKDRRLNTNSRLETTFPK